MTSAASFAGTSGRDRHDRRRRLGHVRGDELLGRRLAGERVAPGEELVARSRPRRRCRRGGPPASPAACSGRHVGRRA